MYFNPICFTTEIIFNFLGLIMGTRLWASYFDIWIIFHPGLNSSWQLGKSRNLKNSNLTIFAILNQNQEWSKEIFEAWWTRSWRLWFYSNSENKVRFCEKNLNFYSFILLVKHLLFFENVWPFFLSVQERYIWLILTFYFQFRSNIKIWKRDCDRWYSWR